LPGHSCCTRASRGTFLCFGLNAMRMVAVSTAFGRSLRAGAIMCHPFLPTTMDCKTKHAQASHADAFHTLCPTWVEAGRSFAWPLTSSPLYESIQYRYHTKHDGGAINLQAGNEISHNLGSLTTTTYSEVTPFLLSFPSLVRSDAAMVRLWFSCLCLCAGPKRTRAEKHEVHWQAVHIPRLRHVMQ
jgi:hypothetical protein